VAQMPSTLAQAAITKGSLGWTRKAWPAGVTLDDGFRYPHSEHANTWQAMTDEQWLAAIEYLRLLETTWDATAVVQIIADGAHYAGTCSVTVRVSVPQLAGPGKCHKFEETGTFPSGDFTTVGALVYFLLHRADAHIGSALHVQQALPF